METHSHVGKAYLERAEKLKNKANILGTILLAMVIMSWLSNEYLFKKVKYDSVVIYKKYEKLEELRSTISKGNNNSKADSSIKAIKSRIDSTSYKKNYPEIFEAIENSMPKPFPTLLSQNIKVPFGLLFSSLTVLIFVVYFSYVRKMFLKFSSIGLRIIQKEENGIFNPYYDYGLSFPFWVFPIHNLKVQELKTEELIKTGSNQNKSRGFFLYIVSCHLVLIAIQLRLFYFSFIINDYNKHWILIAQLIAIGIHFLLVVLWFSSFHVQNFLKTEEQKLSLDRRKFSIYLGGFTLFTFIGLRLIKERSEIVKSFLNPRTKTSKGSSEHKLCHILELKALKLVENEGIESAYKFIRNQTLKYVVDPGNRELAVSFSRLFDLQLRLIDQFPDRSRKNELILESVRLGKSTNSERIISKMKKWEEKHFS